MLLICNVRSVLGHIFEKNCTVIWLSRAKKYCEFFCIILWTKISAAVVLMSRYAMLCGRPPFETSTLKETYERIVSNRYTVPSHVTPAARDLIGRLLSHYPHDRPSLSVMLRHEFFTSGYMPASLNVNCCFTAPKFPLSEAPVPAPRYFSLYTRTSFTLSVATALWLSIYTGWAKKRTCLSIDNLSLIHIWRCRRIERCRSRWSPYH